MPAPSIAPRTPRRRTSARVRRRRTGCAGSLIISLLGFLALGTGLLGGVAGIGGGGGGRDDIGTVDQPGAIAWGDPQPSFGVDVSFPQCGRTLRDMAGGFAIVGLDGGMPDRPNPCFATLWGFARRQAGAAVYVNTADDGRGDPAQVGRRAALADVQSLADHGVRPGTPVWLDVELPPVWRGTPARHRVVITEHLRVLADHGYPVGVYSAPALWQEITGGADVPVPTWVGIGHATRQRAAATCEEQSFGGRRPDLVQRIGTGSDGRSLDRNLTCLGTDLTGMVRPG